MSGAGRSLPTASVSRWSDRMLSASASGEELFKVGSERLNSTWRVCVWVKPAVKVVFITGLDEVPGCQFPQKPHEVGYTPQFISLLPSAGSDDGLRSLNWGRGQ